MAEARRVLPDVPKLAFVDSQTDALTGADALLIVTEWKEFKSPDFEVVRAMLKQPVILDGRNLYDPAMMKSFGLEYYGVGRTPTSGPAL